MSNKIILKKSSVGAKVPVTGDLDYGELALNYADGKLYFKNSSNAISSFSANIDLSGYASLTGTQTLTNKSLTSPVVTGTLTAGGTTGTSGQFLQSTGSGLAWASPAGGGTVLSIAAGSGLTGGTITSSGTIAIDTAVVATLTGTQTLTNKTINLSNNTLIATSAQLASSLTDETGSGSLVFGTNPSMSLWYDNVGINGLANTTTVAPSYSNSIFHSPMSAVIWHDLVAFGTVWGFPTYETYNGTTWSSATLNKNLFAQKENQSVAVLDGSTTLAARWTWSNAGYSAARWLQIGQAWSTPTPNKTILVQSSSDGGTTWRTLHTSTYSNIAESIFHKLDDLYGDDKLRVTVTWNSGGTVQFANLKILSSRPGDQGRGKEYEYPYTWDATKNMFIGGAGSLLYLNGSTSGYTALQASAAASGTLTLPAATDTLVGKATTDTLTNKTISGASNTLTNIPNSALTNSSVTINGTSISLGGSGSITTSAITEGSNLYYTSARFDTAFSGKTTTNLAEGTNLYYTSARFDSAFTAKSTTNLAEGTNLYYTDARARASISAGTGISYNSTTGVISLPQDVSSTASPTFAALTTTGAAAVGGNLTVTGNLTVNGTTEYLNSTTVQIADKNIELGKVATPTDATADGGGITIKGATDKTFNWVNATSSWTSSENLDLASGKTYKINGSDVLTTSQVLGKTLPSGTVVGTSDSQTLTNKTLSNPTIDGTITSTGTGTPTLTSSTNINLTAANAVVITGSPLRVSSYTTTVRNSLSSSNGDIIYNSTTGKINAYQNGSWGAVGEVTLAGTETLTNKTFGTVTFTGSIIANGSAGTNGYVLKSTGNGVQWAAQSGGALANLTDVSISNAVAQQVLKYNGSQWINAANDVSVASAVFATSQADLGYVTDSVLAFSEDLGYVTDVSYFIYDMGQLRLDGIVSLQNLDQSVKADYTAIAIIFGF